MKRRARRVLLLLAAFLALVWLNNTSLYSAMVILTHPRQTESIHDLPETSEYAAMIPRGYGGAIKTNRIDKIQDWLAKAR